MPGTILLIRIGGIPIRLHFSFLFLVGLLVALSIADKPDYLEDSLLVGCLFGCVLLHELGHAAVARHFGVRTLEIVMYLIGGVARLEKQPDFRQEFWIAIAGPMVNFLLAGGLWLGRPYLGAYPLWQQVAEANLGLGLFNLLPAFPMDGGRILRSILSLFQDELTSTRLAATIGRIVAVAMGIYALYAGQWILLMIAFFVFTNAQQQYFAQRGHSLMEGALVRDAMVTNFLTLSHGSSIRDAAEQLLNTSQQEFPVVHGDQVLGLLNRDAIVASLAENGPDGYVAAAMNRNFLRLNQSEGLESAIPKLSENNFCGLVFEEERLVGILTQENLQEFMVLKNFGLERRKP